MNSFLFNKLERTSKQIIQIFIDLLLFVFSFLFSMYVRLENLNFLIDHEIWLTIVPLIPINFLILYRLGLYSVVVRYVSLDTIKIIFFGSFVSALCCFIISQYFNFPVPRSVPVIFLVFLLISISGVRFLFRYFHSLTKNYRSRPVAIYGAGEAGRQILNALNESREYFPVIFIDDSIKIQGRKVGQLKVYSFEEAVKIFEILKIEIVLIAMPSVPLKVKNNIFHQLGNYPIQVKIIPGIVDLIDNKAEINELRSVSINELLGREPIPPKKTLMATNLKEKIVLVSGAGGSIGSEICRQIIKQKPKKLIILDNSEHNLFLINDELNDILTDKKEKLKIFPILCSVQNSDRIYKIIKKFKVQTIYHAAAYKHVPLLEYNTIEGLENNIFGTKSIADAAIKLKVEKFILISSDKAVRPTNFMGVSKRLAEIICQSYSKRSQSTVFSIVRFGNVLGSSGSVIPKFEKQIKNGGPITVTHKEIKRYFMTIEEASQLVIQAGSMSKGGEVFVLDMGEPLKILDLASKMANLHGLNPCFFVDEIENEKDILISIIGLRPGEKLYEELVIGNETFQSSHPRIFIANEISWSYNELSKFILNIKNAIKKDDIDLIKDIIVKSNIGFKTSS